MSAAFPLTKDLPERVEWWWYETAEEGDIALIEGAGIVLTRTEDGMSSAIAGGISGVGIPAAAKAPVAVFMISQSWSEYVSG